MAERSFSTCGIGYTLYDDGRVEVEGLGFPNHGNAYTAMIQKIWADFGPDIVAAGDKFRLPYAWLVAIIVIESAGKPRAAAACEPTYCPALWNAGKCAAQGGSEKYCAGGLMAFISSTAGIFGKTIEYYMDHPGEMIHDAAWLIAEGGPKKNAFGGGVHGPARNGDVLTVAKQYNGGSSCAGGGLTGHGGQGDYVSKFIKTCNTFVALNLPMPAGARAKGASAATSGAIWAVALGFVAYMFADLRWGISDQILDRLQGPRY